MFLKKYLNRAMKLGAISILALALVSPIAFAQEAKTVDGELVDLACYLAAGEKAMGDKHMQCGLKCVQEGHQPMALVTKDGAVYVIAVSHEDPSVFAQLSKVVNSQVKVTGKMMEQKGLKGIEVSKVEKAS